MTSDSNTDIPFSNKCLGEEQDIKQLTISSSSDEDTSGVTIKRSDTIPSSAKKDNASSVAVKRSVKKVSSSSKGGWSSVPKGSIREGKWGSGSYRSESTSSRGGWATSWETRRPPQGRTWAERLKPRHGRGLCAGDDTVIGDCKGANMLCGRYDNSQKL